MFVDDLYIFATSLKELERMLGNVKETLWAAGFVLADHKSQWIATWPTGNKTVQGKAQNPVWRPMPVLGILVNRKTSPDEHLLKNIRGAWGSFRDIENVMKGGKFGIMKKKILVDRLVAPRLLAGLNPFYLSLEHLRMIDSTQKTCLLKSLSAP